MSRRSTSSIVPVDVFVYKYSTHTHTQTHYNQRPKRDTLFPSDLPDVHLIMSLSHSFILLWKVSYTNDFNPPFLPPSLWLDYSLGRHPQSAMLLLMTLLPIARRTVMLHLSIIYFFSSSLLLLLLLLKRSCYMRTAHWSAQMPRAHNIHFSFCLYVQYRIVVDWYRSRISSTWSIRDVLYLPLRVNVWCHRLTMGGETTRMRK